jgi:hypothetical protein
MLALVEAGVALGAVIVSGSDLQVQRTTLAVDPSGERVVILWESTQFAAHEHVRLNRSVNGGQRWREEALDFALNLVTPWFSDYLPEANIDSSGVLHVLWSQRTDTTSPYYARSPDLGDTWTPKTAIGGGNLPRACGVALSVGSTGSDLWAFYHDTNWHAYACASSDGGQSWAVLADLDGTGSAGDPAQGFCSAAAGHGSRRYVLRRQGDVLQVLVGDAGAWSVRLPPPAGGPLSLAASHTLAVDAQGRLFIAFGSAGKVHCLRSDDGGASFGTQTLVAAAEPGEQTVPVLALLPGNGVALAWQHASGQNVEVHYALSADGGQSFGASRPVAPGRGPQTAPDLCAVGATLYVSFTEQGQACFARLPEPPPATAAGADRANLFRNPGFDDFEGQAPRGWTVTSWNQEFLQERFGRGEPGRDGSGSCLELQAGSGASIITLTAPALSLQGDATYFLKGYYASTCEKVLFRGEWLDLAGQAIRAFEIRLPETQDGWVHVIKELSSPALAQQLRFSIEKKWQSGRVRFDDVSLRLGTVADFAAEFALADPAAAEPWLPIFSWLGPYAWPQLGPESFRSLDQDEIHLDYALAGFTVGYRAKFGVRYHPSPPTTAAALAALERDPAVWTYHGGDEPSQDAFAGIAALQQTLRDQGATKPLWYNLLPTYGFKSYEDYELHIRAYLETVQPRFITYDHYPLPAGNRGYGRDAYANLEIVRHEALAHGVDWGVILQLVAFGGMRSPDEAELRWQACSALAYGARAIGWFTYLTEVEYGGMNWRDAVIDRDGCRTRHYAMLGRVNGELRQLGRTLVGLTSTGVYHTEPLPERTVPLATARLLRAVEGGAALLGEFTDAQGTDYVMVVNRDFTAASNLKLTLRQPAAAVLEISKTTGVPVPLEGYSADSGTLALVLAPGAGRLLRLR